MKEKYNYLTTALKNRKVTIPVFDVINSNKAFHQLGKNRQL